MTTPNDVVSLTLTPDQALRVTWAILGPFSSEIEEIAASISDLGGFAEVMSKMEVAQERLRGLGWGEPSGPVSVDFQRREVEEIAEYLSELGNLTGPDDGPDWIAKRREQLADAITADALLAQLEAQR